MCVRDFGICVLCEMCLLYSLFINMKVCHRLHSYKKHEVTFLRGHRLYSANYEKYYMFYYKSICRKLHVPVICSTMSLYVLSNSQ